MTCGIYKITEHETGCCYVGQSKDIEGRWKYHKGKRGKFPVSAFDYEIVIQCFDEPESLDFWERRCIVDYNAHKSCGGFNHTWGGNGAWGSKNPEETRRKLSEANLGKPLSEETKQKMSEARLGKPPPNKGKSSPKSQCSHCGIWCAANNMSKYHGDNCKKKEV